MSDLAGISQKWLSNLYKKCRFPVGLFDKLERLAVKQCRVNTCG